jgi:O-antigen ligase
MNLSNNFYLTIHTIFQGFTALAIGIGIIPHELVFVALALQLLAVLLFDLEHAFYSVLLSIPFFLILPNPYFESFSAWRVVFAFLFVVYIFKAGLLSLKGIDLKKVRFAPWDKWLAAFAVVILLSVLVAEFKGVAVKKFLFLVNIYLLYIVGLNVIREKKQLLKSMWISFVSLALIVSIGFLQLFVSLKSTVYYLWQYWTVLPARFYYGSTFADTSAYSNSWVAFDSQNNFSLRMFSVLPDSHSFAVTSMFLISLSLTLAIFSKIKWQKNLAWVFVALSSWGVVFSGTRGMWLGAMTALAVITAFYLHFYANKKSFKFMSIPVLLIILFIAISPLTQRGINYIQKGMDSSSSFFDRAGSIYDLKEQSNYGRIAIWQNSLKEVVKRPILGTGLGNFVVTLRDVVLTNSGSYEELANEREEKFNLPGKYITAHSLYLDFLVELGVLGFLAFATYLVSMVKVFWAFLQTKREIFEPLSFYAICFGVYLVWLFSYSLFDGTLLNDRVLMYFFVGLLISHNIIKLNSDAKNID